MKVRELRRALAQAGVEELRQSGSHLIVRAPDGCRAVLPIHTGDISPGVLRDIARKLEPCIGRQEWMP